MLHEYLIFYLFLHPTFSDLRSGKFSITASTEAERRKENFEEKNLLIAGATKIVWSEVEKGSKSPGNTQTTNPKQRINYNFFLTLYSLTFQTYNIV